MPFIDQWPHCAAGDCAERADFKFEFQKRTVPVCYAHCITARYVEWLELIDHAQVESLLAVERFKTDCADPEADFILFHPELWAEDAAT